MLIKTAVCQLKINISKKKNLNKAYAMIKEASGSNADIVVLPEIFNCPYDKNLFSSYAEYFGEETTNMLSAAADEFKIYLIGGSIPEKEISKDNKEVYYNTSFIFDPDGSLIGKHRKIHLFDVNIKNKITFMESDVFSAGEQSTVFDSVYCKMGVAICYDMRFPELIRKMTVCGAKVIIVPAAFNTSTGPAHWHLITRSRAIDNQVYFIAASPARDVKAKYIAYGHSLVCNPWGEIISEAGEDETIIYADIDLNFLQKIREELPILKHLRPQIYR